MLGLKQLKPLVAAGAEAAEAAVAVFFPCVVAQL